MSLREEILASKLKEDVVEAFGKKIRVREMNGPAMERYLRLLDKYNTVATGYALIIACHAIDESNELLFTEEDIPELAKLSFTELKRLSDAGESLSRLYTDPDSKNS